MKRQGRSIKDSGASERHSHCHAARCHTSTVLCHRMPSSSSLLGNCSPSIWFKKFLGTECQTLAHSFRTERDQTERDHNLWHDYAKVIIGEAALSGQLWAFVFCLCLSRFCFRWLFRNEFQHIEILDENTETHYDLVFGKFRFDSAQFILNELRDILLISFPSEETLSAKRAGEFVTAVVLHLVQTIASVIAR